MDSIIDGGRRLVHESLKGDVIVSLKVPKAASPGYVPRTEEIPYLLWPISCRGGNVLLVYLYADWSFAGRWITARLQIWEKQKPDGKMEYWVNLSPVPRETEVTHRLVVFDDTHLWQDHWVSFEITGSASFIGLISPDESLVLRSRIQGAHS